MWNLFSVICYTAGTRFQFTPIYTYKPGCILILLFFLTSNRDPMWCHVLDRFFLVVSMFLPILLCTIFWTFLWGRFLWSAYCRSRLWSHQCGPWSVPYGRYSPVRDHILSGYSWNLILVQGNFPATCILLGVLNVHLTSWGVNEALHFTFEKTGTDQKVADTKNLKKVWSFEFY